MKDEIQIPKRRAAEDISIILSPSAAHTTNNEVRSDTAIRGVIAVALLDITLSAGLVFAALFYLSGATWSVLVWLPTLLVFVWRYRVRNIDMMLIISGDYVADRTREDEFKLRSRLADIKEKQIDADIEWQFRKLGQDAEVKIQELLNDNHVRDANEKAAYWKRQATQWRSEQTLDYNPPSDNPAMTVADVGLLFTNWLELAYMDCSESGNVGTEPWSDAGDWTIEESTIFKKHLLPKLKTTNPPVVLKGPQTGNRLKLNLEDWPTFESALEAMEGLW